jgi:hypothetical protein
LHLNSNIPALIRLYVYLLNALVLLLQTERTGIHLSNLSTMSDKPQFDGLHTEMFELGLQNRRAVVGDAYVDAALKNGSSEFSYPGQQLVTE